MAKVKAGVVPAPKIVGVPELAALAGMPLGPAGMPVKRLGLEPVQTPASDTLGVTTPADLGNPAPPPLLNLSQPQEASYSSTRAYPDFTPASHLPYITDLPQGPQAPDNLPIPNVDFAANQAQQRQAIDYAKYLPLLSLLTGNGLMAGANLIPKFAVGAFTGTKTAQDEQAQNALRDYQLQSQQAQQSFGNQEKVYGDQMGRIDALNQLTQLQNRESDQSTDKSYDASVGAYNAAQKEQELQTLATRNQLKDLSDMRANQQEAYNKAVTGLSKMDDESQKRIIPQLIANGSLPASWPKDKDGSYQSVSAADATAKPGALQAQYTKIMEDLSTKAHSQNIGPFGYELAARNINSLQHQMNTQDGTEVPDVTAEDLKASVQESGRDKAYIADKTSQDYWRGKNISSEIDTRARNLQLSSERNQLAAQRDATKRLTGKGFDPQKAAAFASSLTSKLVSDQKAITSLQKTMDKGQGTDLEGNAVPWPADKLDEMNKQLDFYKEQQRTHQTLRDEAMKNAGYGFGQAGFIKDNSSAVGTRYEGDAKRSWIPSVEAIGKQLGVTVSSAARPDQQGTISGSDHESYHKFDMARDFHGSDAAKAAFFSAVRANLDTSPGAKNELFYSPIGFIKDGAFFTSDYVAKNWKNGKELVAKHYSHVHVGGDNILSAGAAPAAVADNTASIMPTSNFEVRPSHGRIGTSNTSSNIDVSPSHHAPYRPTSQMSPEERLAELAALAQKGLRH